MQEWIEMTGLSGPSAAFSQESLTDFAERMDDLQNSKDVQARLLPRSLPRSSNLSCASIYVPAREVGGDFYDWLDFGKDRLGLVIGDVSGKGVAAALQMATLQAQLRSHVSLGVRDLGLLISSVNRLFYECTAATNYASLFLAEYCEREGVLRYINCGHPSPLLLRRDGSMERLDSCATVLALVREFPCAPLEVRFERGDTLILYTDGVTETVGRDGEEFGELRLMHAAHTHRDLSVPAVLTGILAAVQGFVMSRPADDFTMLIVRAA